MIFILYYFKWYNHYDRASAAAIIVIEYDQLATVIFQIDLLGLVGAGMEPLTDLVFLSQRFEDESLQWRHNERDGVAHHWRLDYLLNRLFGHRSKKISKLRVTGLCEGNSPVTGEFPSQRASDAENVSIWWCHHAGVLFWVKSQELIWGSGTRIWQDRTFSHIISAAFYQRCFCKLPGEILGLTQKPLLKRLS